MICTTRAGGSDLEQIHGIAGDFLDRYFAARPGLLDRIAPRRAGLPRRDQQGQTIITERRRVLTIMAATEALAHEPGLCPGDVPVVRALGEHLIETEVAEEPAIERLARVTVRLTRDWEFGSRCRRGLAWGEVPS